MKSISENERRADAFSPSLRFENIRKKFGQREILQNLSLQIHSGELFVLLGPSGAGKSTLLHTVSGLVTVDEGKIFIGHDEVTLLPPNARRVGMVFQDYSLFPSMSIRDNVAFPLIARRTKTALDWLLWQAGFKSHKDLNRLVQEKLELVGLCGHEDKRPTQLSGGEQQRAALARALIFDPDILCFDEPFSALDKNLRQTLQEDIRMLNKDLGKTMLYVTHDQTEAFTMASRVGILHEGRLEQVGAPRDVYSHPETPFVAKFFGDCNVVRFTDSGGSVGNWYVVGPNGCRIWVPKRLVAPGFVGLRPEAFAIRRGEGSLPTLEGHVISDTFLGINTRIELRLDCQLTLRVLIPSDQVADLLIERRKISVEYSPSNVIILQTA